MSGKLFVETLKKIGYNNKNNNNNGDVQELDEENFDWMFEDENLKGFCKWFCENIDQANLIDPAEVEKFNQLSATGQVLELEDIGKLLAHENLSINDDDEEDEDDAGCSSNDDRNYGLKSKSDFLLQKVNSAKDNLMEKKKEKIFLIRQRDILTKQLQKLKDENLKNENLSKLLNEEFQCSMKCLKDDSDDFADLSEKLGASVGKVLTFYEPFKEDCKGSPLEFNCQSSNEDSQFISLQNFEDHLKYNNEFQQLINEYIKVNFHDSNNIDIDNNINNYNSNNNSNPINKFENTTINSYIKTADDTHDDSRPLSLNDLTKCQDSSDDDINNIKKRENSNAGMEISGQSCNDNNDLMLIQENLKSAELSCIVADINKNKITSECEFLEKYISTFQSSSFMLPTEVKDIDIDRHHRDIKFMSDTINRIFNTDISSLSLKLAQFKMLDILVVNYDEKIQKQEEMKTLIDDVIDLLVSNKSFNELLHVLLSIEHLDHKYVCMLLTAADVLLEEVFNQSTIRQAKLKRILSSSSSTSSSSSSRQKEHQDTILPSDTYINTISNMLNNVPIKNDDDNEDDDDSSKLFTTTSTLLDRVRRLVARHSDNESSKALNRCIAQENAAMLSKQQRETVKLFPLDDAKPSNAIGSELELSQASNLLPQPIITKMTELDELLHKVKLTFTEIIQSLEDKRKILKRDELLAYERHLFVDFFTNESRLRRKVKELQDRAKLPL